MQRTCFRFLLALSVFLMSSAVWGSPQPGACESLTVLSKVQGVKIVSYIHDAKAHSGSITFQNDSPKKDIEVVQGEVFVTHQNGRVSLERNLRLGLGDLYHAARMRVRPDSPIAKTWYNTHARGPLKPGEIFTQDFSYAFSYGVGEEAACVNVLYEFVVYSDHSAESANDKMLQDYINNSISGSQRTDALVQAATDILNAKVEHPFSSFLKLANERDYRFSQVAYEMPQAGDDDATEAAKLRHFIALHKEISKLCIENSHVKVVAQ